jgi:HlyD family secretion protein
MVRRRVWLPGLGALVVLILIGANLLHRRPEAKQVDVEKVSRRSLETWVRAPGVIRPLVSIDVSSNVMGRVEKLYVREGDAVRKGQLLLTLDDTRLRSAVQQYEAMLRAAESQRTLQEAQLERANQVLARRRELHQQGLLSVEGLEEAQVEARVREAQVGAQVEEIERLRAALAENRRNLEETRFYAPIDGIVTALNLEEGENVVIGTMNAPGTVILTVADRDSMEVEARVSESDVVLVRAGQRVRVDVDAAPDSLLEGLVTEVGESGDRRSRDEGSEFLVRSRILQPPDWLKTGMSADVEILVAQADSVPCMPIQALVARTEETVRRWNEAAAQGKAPPPDEPTRDRSREDPSAPTNEEPRRQKLIEGVFHLKDGVGHFVPVTTGIRGEAWIEIVSGVAPDAEIVVGPYRTLRHLKDGEHLRAKSRARRERDS